VQQGIPAVIAMQFEVTDEAAITFAYDFYGALADGYPVDAAIAEARKAIYAQGNDIEWGTPVLYMRSPDGRLFDIEQISDEERRETKIAALYREAKTAMAEEDWRTAIEMLQEVLKLKPAYAEAKARLKQAREEQELADLYAQSLEHYKAEYWFQALDCLRRVQNLRANYKEVDDLIAAVERARDEQDRRNKVTVLLLETKEPIAKEDWQTAIEKYQTVLNLEPNHVEANAGLMQARREQELADLYAQGQTYYEAGRLPEALECFRQVEKIRAHYKQTDDFIAAIERAQDEQRRREKSTVLLHEAKEASDGEDWRTVIEKYQAVLELEPAHVEAKTGLNRARQEQALADLYAQGQAHYEAGHWSQALACLRQVQKIRAHYKQADDLIPVVERAQDEQARDEQSRRGKTTILLREVQEAAAKEDWQTASEKYQQILELEPTYAEAKAGLSQAQQEQKLADLYAQGQAHYAARRWSEALDCLRQVQKIRPHYKQVEDLITAIERAQDEQNRREKSTVLLREAKEAVAKENWQTVTEKYQAFLKLEPTHAEAKAGLKQSRHEQELSELYAQGREHYEARRWPQALKCFHRIQKMRANYKDVDALVTAINKEAPKKDKGRAPVRKLVALVSVLALLAIVFVLIVLRKERSVPATETALSISTQPDGAMVLLNGDSIGVTPISNFSVKAGMISLHLQMPNYMTLDTSLAIKAGQPLSFSFTLEKIPPPPPNLGGVHITARGGETTPVTANLIALMGALQITSEPPGASIWLDGEAIRGKTTPDTIQNLKIGVHKIVLRKEGYKEYSGSIMVKQKQVCSVEVKLIALFGKLKVLVKPYGSIYIDDVLRIKDTDVKHLIDLQAGSHRVKAEHPLFDIWEKTVEIKPDSLHEIIFDFTRK